MHDILRAVCLVCMTIVMPEKDKRRSRYMGATGRKRENLCTISLAAWQARLVHQRVADLGLRGPSDFFQRLISEAHGAKLPCVSTPYAGGK